MVLTRKKTGFPVLSFVRKKVQGNQGGFNLGGINATGQVPDMPGNWGLIDKDTPKEAYTRKSYMSNEEYVLVFSDEFNLDGRSFFPGDDPYWEAVDLHYWGTVRSSYKFGIMKSLHLVLSGCQNDLEWYDASQRVSLCFHNILPC